MPIDWSKPEVWIPIAVSCTSCAISAGALYLAWRNTRRLDKQERIAFRLELFESQTPHEHLGTATIRHLFTVRVINTGRPVVLDVVGLVSEGTDTLLVPENNTNCSRDGEHLDRHAHYDAVFNGSTFARDDRAARVTHAFVRTKCLKTVRMKHKRLGLWRADAAELGRKLRAGERVPG